MLARFLTQLFDSGEVCVALPGGALEHDPEAVAVLERRESLARRDAPGHPPAFDPAVGLWAAERMLRAAQFLVFREVPEDVVQHELAVAAPDRPGPSRCWSADLVLRFLPDVVRLSAGAAPTDPLVEALRQLARDWPLSSIGAVFPSPPTDVDIEAKEPESAAPPPAPAPATIPIDRSEFWPDASLRMLFIDRVIQREDLELAAQPDVLEEIAIVAGDHPALLPAAVQRLLVRDPDDGALVGPLGADRP